MLARWSALPFILAAFLAAAGLQLAILDTPTAVAQVQRGATLTVLRGEVAVVRPNGSAVQPAPSGTVVDSGDEIRTLTRAGALITFFTGTEIEMGEGTILAVDEITRDGDKINVSLKQVLGVTINRVQSLGAPGSSYQIDAGGAVAVVRGTTFALAGPAPTAVGNVVSLACLADCSPASMLGGCAMQPYMGIGVVVSQGKVASGCQTWSVKSDMGLFDAAVEGITTTEHAVQGGNPGQVSLGTQIATGKPVESNSNRDKDKEKEEDKNCPTAEAPLLPAGFVEAVALTGVGTAPGHAVLMMPWLVFGIGRSSRGLRSASRPARRNVWPLILAVTMSFTLLSQLGVTSVMASASGANPFTGRVITQPASPQEAAQAIGIPAGSIVAASFNGSDPQGIGISTTQLTGFPTQGNSFLILSTGAATAAEQPNNSPGTTTVLGGLNNSQGNDMVQFAVTVGVPGGVNCASVDFRFLSDEFPEFVGSTFNDTFLAERGTSSFTITANSIIAPNNFAFDPQGRPISVNTVLGVNAANAQGTTYDGATPLLRASTPVTAGTNIQFTFSITDLGDSNFDSAVFLDNLIFFSAANCATGANTTANVPTGTPVAPPAVKPQGC